MLHNRKITLHDVEIVTNADWEKEFLPKKQRWYNRWQFWYALVVVAGVLILNQLLKMAYANGFQAGQWTFW